jgi:hypothetical protein
MGLACIQKLIANDAVAPHHLPAVVGTFSQQAEVLDEATQLKCLQGVLTVLQSKVCPEEEEAMSPMLSMCFRLLSAARGTDSVRTTAAATVRQAVAIVFARVSPSLAALRKAYIKTGPGDVGGVGDAGASAGDGGGGGGGMSACVQTAFLLFEDLCALAGGP